MPTATEQEQQQYEKDYQDHCDNQRRWLLHFFVARCLHTPDYKKSVYNLSEDDAHKLAQSIMRDHNKKNNGGKLYRMICYTIQEQYSIERST